MSVTGSPDLTRANAARTVGYGRLFDEAPWAMVVLDNKRCITAANRLATKILSLPLESFVGQPFVSFLVDADRAHLQAALMEREGSRDVEVRVTVGTRTGMLVLTMGQLTGEDPAFDTLIVIRDATPMEALGDTRNQSSKMEALGRLAGGIAHDFNTALTGIAGCADVALRHIDIKQPAYEYIVEIKDAAMRASAMPRRLLDFSRHRVTASSVFELDPLLVSLEPAFRRIFDGRITLLLALESAPVRVRCDESQMAQAVTNLLTNARDAIDGAGRIDVETASVIISRASPGRLRYLPAGRYVRLTVRDSGCGMDDATLSRAYEPFFSTKQERDGTGLGLTMVATTIEAANGHVETSSRLGAGTKVDVYLPAVEPGVPMLKAELGGHETILLVEDDRLVRKTLRDNLEYRGYRVVEADSGSEALRKSRTYPGSIDLVLADMIMPGMTGPDVVRDLRVQRPGLRVVFMSASYLTHELIADARLDRGRNFIEKPFDERQLAALLRNVLAEP